MVFVLIASNVPTHKTTAYVSDFIVTKTHAKNLVAGNSVKPLRSFLHTLAQLATASRTMPVIAWVFKIIRKK